MTAVTDWPAALVMLHANSDDGSSVQRRPADRKYNPDTRRAASDEVLPPSAPRRHPAPFPRDDTHVIRWIWRMLRRRQLYQGVDELVGALCQSHITLIKTSRVHGHTSPPPPLLSLALQVMNSSASAVYHLILLNLNVTAQFSQNLYWSYSRVPFAGFRIF